MCSAKQKHKSLRYLNTKQWCFPQVNMFCKKTQETLRYLNTRQECFPQVNMFFNKKQQTTWDTAIPEHQAGVFSSVTCVPTSRESRGKTTWDINSRQAFPTQKYWRQQQYKSLKWMLGSSGSNLKMCSGKKRRRKNARLIIIVFLTWNFKCVPKQQNETGEYNAVVYQYETKHILSENITNSGLTGKS